MSICKYYTLFCVLKENFFSELFVGFKPYRQYTEKLYLSNYLSITKSNYYKHYLSFKTPVYLHFIAGKHNLFNKALKYGTLLRYIIILIQDIFSIIEKFKSIFEA